MKNNPVIVIMAKVPQFGDVKTRLQSVLTQSQRVELAIAFLQDTVKKSLIITDNIIVAFAPAEEKKQLQGLLPSDLILVEQRGNNLGERMQSAIEFAENKGFNQIIVIGTDSPTLPPEYLKQAFIGFENEEAKVILGKSDDGGFYLIGLRKWTDGLFKQIEWSSTKTFVSTVENIEKIYGVKPLEIPSWRDVDTPADLKILVTEFTENADLAKIAPHTAKWISINAKSVMAKV